jgi:hypothetical protein
MMGANVKVCLLGYISSSMINNGYETSNNNNLLLNTFMTDSPLLTHHEYEYSNFLYIQYYLCPNDLLIRQP